MNQERALNDILEIVQFIRDNAVSKEDAKAFATKEDLERFATKTDLERFATKTDLERFATKEDVHEIVNEAVGKAKREIMDHLDGLAVVVKKVDEERLAMQANFDRLTGEVRRFAGSMNFQLHGV